MKTGERETMSSTEANKALVRRHFVDALHDPSICDAIYAPALPKPSKTGRNGSKRFGLLPAT